MIILGENSMDDLLQNLVIVLARYNHIFISLTLSACRTSLIPRLPSGDDKQHCAVLLSG